MTSDEYRQAIGELARGATMPDDAAARMEARLAQAFESSASRPEEGPARPLNVFRPLAAAAAIIITLGAGVWYAVRQAVTSNNVTTTPVTSEARLNASPTDTVHLKVDATEKVHLKVDATDKVPGTEGGRRGSGSVRLPPSPRLRRTAVASAEAGQADRTLPKKLPPVIRPQGFVAVPAAAGLPQFESGVILRLSLPVAALPSYGVDISPASSHEPVEADVLVGQDGRARAIRLVNSSRSQQ